MGNTKRACAANPVPCGCWRGRGGMSAPRIAAKGGVPGNTATLVPGRLRGAMARPGCLRRAVGRGRDG